MIHPRIALRQHGNPRTERGRRTFVVAPPVGLEPATSGDVSRKNSYRSENFITVFINRALKWQCRWSNAQRSSNLWMFKILKEPLINKQKSENRS